MASTSRRLSFVVALAMKLRKIVATPNTATSLPINEKVAELLFSNNSERLSPHRIERPAMRSQVRDLRMPRPQLGRAGSARRNSIRP